MKNGKEKPENMTKYLLCFFYCNNMREGISIYVFYHFRDKYNKKSYLFSLVLLFLFLHSFIHQIFSEYYSMPGRFLGDWHSIVGPWLMRWHPHSHCHLYYSLHDIQHWSWSSSIVFATCFYIVLHGTCVTKWFSEIYHDVKTC